MDRLDTHRPDRGSGRRLRHHRVGLVAYAREYYDSLRLSLDGVPDGIDLAKIEQAMCRVEGVAAVHHIHVWAISTTENALTAHVVLSTTERLAEVKAALKATLAAADIRHVTLEFETAAEHCADLRD